MALVGGIISLSKEEEITNENIKYKNTLTRIFGA